MNGKREGPVQKQNDSDKQTVISERKPPVSSWPVRSFRGLDRTRSSLSVK